MPSLPTRKQSITIKHGYKLLFISILIGCSNAGSGNRDCPYGAPEPIFSAALPTVTAHAFQLTGQEGEERITFADGLELTILQSGCEAIRQEFHFYLIKPVEEGNWFEEAAGQFYRLAALEEQFFPFNAWGYAIGEADGLYGLAEIWEAEPGFFIQVDYIESTEQPVLVVVLAQGTI